MKQSSEFMNTRPAVTVLSIRICRNLRSNCSESQGYQSRLTHRGNQPVNGLGVRYKRPERE
jgi:hypothetical protein